MRMVIFIWASLLCLGTCLGAEANPARALYLSGNNTYLGFVHKPEGKGPFPAVVFNQSPLNSKNFNMGKDYALLAKSFTSRGYAFFIPGRHPIAPEILKQQEKLARKERFMLSHDQHAANIVAAIAWLKTQMYVQESRVAVIGDMAGGVSSLLAMEQDLGIRGLVLFSPSPQAFDIPPATRRMTTAIRKSSVPILLIQLENDGNARAAKVLGPEIEKKPAPSRVKVFPSYGETKSDLQKFTTEGFPVWQRDVLGFLGEVTGKVPKAGAP